MSFKQQYIAAHIQTLFLKYKANILHLENEKNDVNGIRTFKLLLQVLIVQKNYFETF